MSFWQTSLMFHRIQRHQPKWLNCTELAQHSIMYALNLYSSQRRQLLNNAAHSVWISALSYHDSHFTTNMLLLFSFYNLQIFNLFSPRQRPWIRISNWVHILRHILCVWNVEYSKAAMEWSFGVDWCDVHVISSKRNCNSTAVNV